MSTANEKLAASLDELRKLQADGWRIFQTRQFGRTSKERLIKNGFLVEAMPGWLVSTSPSTQPGDTTPWFSSFWEFLRKYCDKRFGTEWHLSAEQSLLLHAESTVVPRQVIVHSPEANNNRVELAFDTSIFALKVKAMPPARDLEVKDGLHVFRIAAALTRATESFFENLPVEARIVLDRIRDSSEVLSRLLEGGHAVVAGRLAGAFRHVGRKTIADEIVAAMTAADHQVRETNPMQLDLNVVRSRSVAAPIVTRLRTLWASTRDDVLAVFPKSPGPPKNRAAYLRDVDDVYRLDAYHSLSIEGYQVTPELVKRVATGEWDPTSLPSDRAQLDALAARGYWLAFQDVREAVKQALSTSKGLAVVRKRHRDWFRQLFAPYISAGVFDEALLAGYRTQPVFLRGSRHVPPRWESLGEAMETLFDLIEHEPEASVRAVLGHWLIGFVHPFPDGNGRVARFAMNTLLAGGGYPWTVIRVDDRSEYLAALETASLESDLRSFATFIVKQMKMKRPTTRTRKARK